ARHAEAPQHEIHRSLAQEGEGGVAVAGGLHVAADLLQVELDQALHVAFVVDDEDAFWAHRGRRSTTRRVRSSEAVWLPEYSFTHCRSEVQKAWGGSWEKAAI